MPKLTALDAVPDTIRRQWSRWDHAHVWHPFTQMKDWLKREPLIVLRGQGSVVWDSRGRSYLDANSSIWTNLHGHCHPKISAAIRAQLKKIAHSSALGLANEPASILARDLVIAAKCERNNRHHLCKVFFSDDGSTALEVALKMAFAVAKRIKGLKWPRFLSLHGGYHGDTIGAVSVGHIELFHSAYKTLLFKSDAVMAPYCYRCPFNRAKPERTDARLTRKCEWECIAGVERALHRHQLKQGSYAGMVIEPGIQGAAGMIPQPEGWLTRVDRLLKEYSVPMIADEVMTGFGRAVRPNSSKETMSGRNDLFVSTSERIKPQFLALAKGLTGGYLPMAATLTTDQVFGAFLGEYEEFKTFFHGHSYTANQLGAAAGVANLKILSSRQCSQQRQRLARWLEQSVQQLWASPYVGDIRVCGLVAGVELVQDWRSKIPLPLTRKVGIRVCEIMRKRGVLTRPIGNVIVLMPPYCTTQTQCEDIVAALLRGIHEVLGTKALT